jgi:epoxyqueuosine reductase
MKILHLTQEPDPRQSVAARFYAVRFCQAGLGLEVRERLTHFLEAGYHGEMGWLAVKIQQRSHPQSL